MQEKYSGAIYIIGPDLKKFYQQELSFFQDRFDDVLLIGNGQVDILDDNGIGALQTIYTIKEENPGLLNQERLLIYVKMHGAELDNTHVLQTGENSLLESKALFTLLANNINIPMDIIFSPCNGKAAIKYFDILPKDSCVIAFSEANKLTASSNVAYVFDTMPDNRFTLNDFYNYYLANLFSTDENPVMNIVGKEIIDPLGLSEVYLGQNISLSSRLYIHNHFGFSTCSNDMACHNKIDLLINKIEKATSIDEFKINDINYYNVANEIFMQLYPEYIFARDRYHHKEVVYSNNEPDYCYAGILEFKNKADNLLLQHDIHLELDLSEQDWFNVNEEYAEDEMEMLKSSSDVGMLYTLNCAGFKENNGFINPEHGEYGAALGIIKDIHLSLYE